LTVVEVVVVGEWLYADVQTRRVVILRANYDFWYEIAKADGSLEPGEQPSLNADGFQYYLLYDKWPEGGRFWPDGSALTERDAKKAAEKGAPVAGPMVGFVTPPRLMTIDQAAEELQASRNTVYRLISSGALKAVDVAATGRTTRTRILTRDLDAFIESRTRRVVSG